MPSELNYADGRSSLSVTARLVLDGAYVGDAIACSELPASSGHYSADVPAGTAAALYEVLFFADSNLLGQGQLAWDGTAEITPLTQQSLIESRLAAADYTVAPTANQVAIAVSTELSDEFAAIPTNPVLATDSRLDYLDAAISSRFELSSYTAPDNASISTLIARLTDVRASYLDEIPELATSLEINALQTHGDANWLTATGFSTHAPADIWAVSDRVLSGTPVANITQVAGQPVSNVLDFQADISSLPTLAAIEGSTVLAKEATVNSRLADADYETPPTTSAIATAVENQLADDFAGVSGGGTGGFIQSDRTALLTLLNLAQADEQVSPDRYRKLAAGTTTVLLSKSVSNDGAGTISVVAS